MACNSLKVKLYFAVTSRFHLQSQSYKPVLIAAFLLVLFFDTEYREDYFLLKRRMIFNGLHNVIYQKMEFFITTAVRTLNSTHGIIHRYPEYNLYETDKC
jgi:hypothetical protein